MATRSVGGLRARNELSGSTEATHAFSGTLSTKPTPRRAHLKRRSRLDDDLRRSVCVTLHKNAGFTADTNTSSKSLLAPHRGASGKGGSVPSSRPGTGTQTDAWGNVWNLCQRNGSPVKPQGDMRDSTAQGIPTRQPSHITLRPFRITWSARKHKRPRRVWLRTYVSSRYKFQPN